MKCIMLIKRLLLQRLFLFIILCNSIFNIVTAATANAAPPISGWLSIEPDLDRSEIPKNILLGVNTGGWSLLRPVLTIGNILADRGYNVTLAARGKFSQSPQYPKINFISIGDDFYASKTDGYQKLVYGKFDMSKYKIVLEIRSQTYNETFLRLKQISEAVKPDLFLCDTLSNEACADVAWLTKKPYVGVSTSFIGISNVPYRSDPLFGCKVSMENEPFWQRFKCEIFSRVKLFLFNPYSDELSELRASYGLPTINNIFERWQDSLFLFDTFFGFEIPGPLPPLHQDIGPALPDYFPPLTPDLEEFITSRKRIMFVALGTFLYLSPENNAKLLQSLIEAIEHDIIDGAIWGNIKKKQQSFPSNLTLSDGRIISTSDVFDNKYPNIHIASYVPQFSILNHTNTKIFLSHCGSGSTYETLFTGTPVLSLPIAFDQFGNADKLVSAGVALRLDKLDLRVNDILDKIEFLQKDEQVQFNAKRLKTLARINSKRKYRAADLIEYTLHSYALKQKDDDEGEVEDRVFRGLITSDTKMGFIRGKYLDVYAAAISVIIGFLWILSMVGKLIFGKLWNESTHSKFREQNTDRQRKNE